MQIEWIALKGFRNFFDTTINFREKTLVIGANDVGKTNLLYAIRILMDRSLPDTEIEPNETDFYIDFDGSQSDALSIVIKLTDIDEDAVISRLKGNVSSSGETFLKYEADYQSLSHRLFIGHASDAMEEVDSRSYLKHIHFRYIQSSRDLVQYIRAEKKHLLRLSKDVRDDGAVEADHALESTIQKDLLKINSDVNNLSYVGSATEVVNEELEKLSHHHAEFSVSLETKGVNFSTFIEQLSLGAKTSERSVGLGGDGRNNQILMALWKAKSEREHDISSEAIIYCIEEPESHLHPHQQRKLAKYLITELSGQVFVSTHSPQITAQFSPDSIVRLHENNGRTEAASNGCSKCIEDAWRDLGYRMSIISAEAFFSDAVLLVEGPSEVLFYQELSQQLELDLDFYNVNVISVDGIAFGVYVHILDAMKIPWVMRTDNDVFKVPRSNPQKWRFAGLNRALDIAGEPKYDSVDAEWTPAQVHDWWITQPDLLTPKDIYLAKVDLEHDLGSSCSDAIKRYAEVDDIIEAIEFMQKHKAINMGGFLASEKIALKSLSEDSLALPLHRVIELAKKRRGIT